MQSTCCHPLWCSGTGQHPANKGTTLPFKEPQKEPSVLSCDEAGFYNLDHYRVLNSDSMLTEGLPALSQTSTGMCDI